MDFLSWTVEIGAPGDYRRAKALLNAGRHPAFVGPGMVARAAAHGGLLFAVAGSGARRRDAAVALVNPRNSTLLVLNVHPRRRGGGLGAAFLDYLRPNFARVLLSAVPWFQRRGYTPLGDPKPGRRFSTQVMVRRELIALAGRAASGFGMLCACDRFEIDDKQSQTATQGHGHRPQPRAAQNPVPLASDRPRRGAALNTVRQFHRSQAMSGNQRRRVHGQFPAARQVEAPRRVDDQGAAIARRPTPVFNIFAQRKNGVGPGLPHAQADHANIFPRFAFGRVRGTTKSGQLNPRWGVGP
ncbi:MAG: hypothetical protein ACRD2F_03205 [Terriglobales bacterium]